MRLFFKQNPIWEMETYKHSTTLGSRDTAALSLAGSPLTNSDVVPWIGRWWRSSWDGSIANGPVTTETTLLIFSIANEANDYVIRDGHAGWRSEATVFTCSTDETRKN